MFIEFNRGTETTFQDKVGFEVGDKVRRQKVAGSASKGYLHGVVVEVRERPHRQPVFDVRWAETNVIDKGYVASGLERDHTPILVQRVTVIEA